jgi:hypothetical protein
MPEPTAQELLVLNTLLYGLDPQAAPPGTSVYDIAIDLWSDPVAMADIAARQPAEMSAEEFSQIARTIASDRPVYGQMIIKDIEATPASPLSGEAEAGRWTVNATIDYGGQPIILFKGTGGDAAWRDNGEGGYASVTDTIEQQAALEYFNRQMEDYPGVGAVVSGHSKGGNKAQYVAITGGDRVKEAFSFDGQGFNRPFLLKYADEIAANGGKITSISNEYDYVNLLFTPVPGSRRFYTHVPDGAADGATERVKRWHSPVTMLTNVNGFYALDTAQFRGVPSAAMQEIAAILAFAQEFMSKDDFEFLCYAAVSHFMKEPLPYGQRRVMPASFLDRLKPIARSYTADTGRRWAAQAWFGANSSNLPQVVFQWRLANWLGEHYRSGLTYTTVPRDFRDEVKQRLMALVGEVEDEPFWDVTRWDVWYRINRLFGGFGFADDESARQRYYRKMIDIGNVSRAEIERIFADVAAADEELAGKTRTWYEQVKACHAELQSISCHIPG